MEFRNILISNPAKLSLKQGQLCIAQTREVLVPMEDICTLMLESRQVQLTAAVLEALAAQGVTVFFCDEKHLPSAQLLAFHPHYRQGKLLNAQLAMKKPLQKRLWQELIRQKLRNQGACLALAGKEGAQMLADLATAVRSGDPENLEAVAAHRYFPLLFRPGFTRGEDCLENAMLNYGYSILRGAIARNLVMHGLEPSLGLFHHNEGNPFNLADDLIEPYRPLVDLYVATHCDGKELTPQKKRELFNLTNYLVRQDEKRLRVMTSIDRTTAALAAIVTQPERELELPGLIPLEEGRYE